MAKLKEYNRSVTIPGLPDTTNISDPQLRLFLDRIKLFCTELAVTVKGVERYKDIDNIAADLMKSEYFNNSINKTITQTVTPIIDNKIINVNDKRRKDDVPLESIDVTPKSMMLNVYISETGYVQEDYTPHNTSSRYKGVVWSSSDNAVATVDQNGFVTAVAVGECLVTAASTFNSSITASAAVEVINAETITVNAAYRWCADGESSSVYTEAQEPSAGNFAWAATENIVTLYPDKTENESKALVAKTSISATDTRAFLEITDGDGKRFWRDEEKDVAASYNRIRLNGYWSSGSLRDDVYTNKTSGIAIFTPEAPPTTADTTAVIQEAYWTAGRANDYADMEYAKANQRKDAVKVTDTVIWKTGKGTTNWVLPDDNFVHILDSNQYTHEYTSIRRALNFAGETTTVGGDGRHSGKWYKYITTPINGYSQLTVWLQAEYIGGGWPTNDWAFINHTPNEDGDGWVDRAIDGGGSAWIEYNGYKYYEYGYGLLYDLKYYRAWTLSPCHQVGVSPDQITVYTDLNTKPEDVTAGDEGTGTSPTGIYIPYYDDYGVNEVLWLLESYVAATGSGVYSITGENGTTYYRHE